MRKSRWVYFTSNYRPEELIPTGRYRITLEGEVQVEFVCRGAFPFTKSSTWRLETEFLIAEEVTP
jgi:hypothetical protein